MAVAVASVSTLAWANNNSTVDVVVTKPTGLAAGDLMVAQICTEGGINVTPPAGWTLATSNSDNGISRIYWKIADSSDAAATNFRFEIDGTNISAGAIYRITGHDPNTPIIANNSGSANDTTTPSFAIGITPAANSLIILFARFNIGFPTFSSWAIATNNPTWTENYDFNDGANVAMGSASAVRTQATGTGNMSVTGTDATGGWVANIVAIQPPVPSVFLPARRSLQAINRASTY